MSTEGDARRLPVDNTGDEAARPQDVSGVVVTMDEAPAPVEDRAAEHLDRPLPDSRLRRPLRGRVRLLRVVLVETDLAWVELDGVHGTKDLGETPQPTIDGRRIPDNASRKPRH
jgi:hypothetical protein